MVAQEAKARRDIERLVAMRAAALADPEAYVRSILDGVRVLLLLVVDKLL